MDSDRRESSALVTRGIIAVITAVILIFLLVYATNRDTLRARRSAGTQTTDSAAGTITIASDERQTEFGVQIGSDLKAFVADDAFFDGIGETQEEPYTEEDTESVSLMLADEDGIIVVRIVDDAGTVVTGELFSVSVARRIGDSTGGEIVYVDDDKDGIIRVRDVSNGRFAVTLKETEGYRVPQESSEIEVGNTGSGTGNSGETEDNGNNGDNGNEDTEQTGG
ncbi:MAG: hypothetical protein IJQ21_06795 [Lachnospiraceae bacterium]|nr:hypothetical protein [Lachnospiraceae bacterium]